MQNVFVGRRIIGIALNITQVSHEELLDSWSKTLSGLSSSSFDFLTNGTGLRFLVLPIAHSQCSTLFSPAT